MDEKSERILELSRMMDSAIFVGFVGLPLCASIVGWTYLHKETPTNLLDMAMPLGFIVAAVVLWAGFKSNQSEWRRLIK